MKKLVLAGCLALGSTSAFAQTTLFQDDFEGFININWLLNTLGGGENQWTINASYTGDAPIPDSPSQPASFNGGTNSTYLHVYNYPECNGFVPGTCNANFDPNFVSDEAAEMQSGFSTLNTTDVTLHFWYTCAGEAGVSFGTIEYTIDQGTTWTQIGPEFSGVSTWTEFSITDAIFDNQDNLRFRFRWQNGASGDNPPFSIDEITVVGNQAMPSEVITMQHLDPLEYCPGDAGNVGFEATGTYNAGNVFTAQLSDAFGSFATPVDIGTLNSSASGIQSISAVYPVTTPAGTGYRVRVVSSDPAVIGGDNGEDAVFNPLPAVSVSAVPADGMICEGESIEMTASGADTYSWTPTVSNPTAAVVTASPAASTTYTVTGTNANTGCSNTAMFQVGVEDCAGIGEHASVVFGLYPNPANGIVHIQYATAVAVTAIDLLDESGRVVRKLNAEQTSFDVSDLKTGTYIVRIVHAAGTETARLTRY